MPKKRRPAHVVEVEGDQCMPKVNEYMYLFLDNQDLPPPSGILEEFEKTLAEQLDLLNRWQAEASLDTEVENKIEQFISAIKDFSERFGSLNWNALTFRELGLLWRNFSDMNHEVREIHGVKLCMKKYYFI